MLGIDLVRQFANPCSKPSMVRKVVARHGFMIRAIGTLIHPHPHSMYAS
jgi:hypothetical protein